MTDAPQQRRADDPRIEQLQRDVAEMKVTVVEMKEILASFKVALKLAKGCGILAAAGTAVVGFIVSLKSGFNQLVSR